MPHRTDIEWTDYASNPLRVRMGDKSGWGCVKISPGCAKCYAETINLRFGTKESYNAAGIKNVEQYLDEKELQHILNFRPKGPFRGGTTKPKVFVCDMTDLFGEWVSDATIGRMFAAFHLRPGVIFQVLTKRAERMCKYVTEWLRQQDGTESPPGTVKPLANVWLGVSCEDQQRADERIPWLLKTPAAVRFVSAEPLLGPINLVRWLTPFHGLHAQHAGLNWLIVGGESGPGARPCDVAWIRSIIEQCQAASVACFVKQLGSRPYERCPRCDVMRGGSEVEPDCLLCRGSGRVDIGTKKKGGDPDEWSEDLRVRQLPGMEVAA